MGTKKELGHPKVLGHNKHPGLLALKENTKIKRTCPSGTAVNYKILNKVELTFVTSLKPIIDFRLTTLKH